MVNGINLEKLSNLFKKINKKVFVIPGNHDVKWTEMGGMEFSQIFDDNKFRFDTLNYVFLGLNTGIVLRGGGGHITPESLNGSKRISKKSPLIKRFSLHITLLITMLITGIKLPICCAKGILKPSWLGMVM